MGCRRGRPLSRGGGCCGVVESDVGVICGGGCTEGRLGAGGVTILDDRDDLRRRFKIRRSSDVSCGVLAGVGRVELGVGCGGEVMRGRGRERRGSPLDAIESAALLIAISTEDHQARSWWYVPSKRV